MGLSNGDRETSMSEEQLIYARVLAVGVQLAFALLAVGALAYFSGVLEPAVPPPELPRLWMLSASGYLNATGIPRGWGWISMLARGDMLPLAGIALLAGASVPCLLALIPGYADRRDWVYLGITLALIGVLVLAGAGVFGAH